MKLTAFIVLKIALRRILQNTMGKKLELLPFQVLSVSILAKIWVLMAMQVQLLPMMMNSQIMMRMFANHGALQKHHHEIEGINSRMDGLQAGILSVQLKYIDECNLERYRYAILQNEQLKNIKGVTIPKIRPNALHIFHLYVMRTKKRDEWQKYLKEREIATGIHYPVTLPFMKAYEYLKHRYEDFPVAHQYQNEISSLPMYPELSVSSISFMADTIKGFFSR